MQKIKILYVLTVLNKGGLETMIMNYYRNFDKTKFEFHFLVHRDSGYFENELIGDGAFIHRASPLSFSFRNFIKYRKELDIFFKNNHFDIVHVHNNSFGYFPLKYAKKNGAKVRIIHSHSSALKDDVKKILLGKLLNKKIPTVATHLFACGDEAGKWMYKNKKFEIIPNAIEVDKFAFNPEIRNSFRENLSAQNTINIVNVARFNYFKNHLFLLDVFAEIIKKNGNYKLFLVGDGELKSQILDKIKRLNLENHVELLGVRDDVAEILQAMDIFIFPSSSEGFGIAFLEAQATGIQCVISDGVPAESILVKENVKVISLKENAEQWANKILEIKNFERKDVSKTIKEKGYDIKENAKKLEKKYRELLTLSKL